jgi:hypothetical protein
MTWSHSYFGTEPLGCRKVAMIRSRGVVVLSAYSRENLVDQCLDSIFSADGSSFVQKLITYQSGFPEVDKVISKYEDPMTSILRVNGRNRSKLQNMNYNYWNGFNVAFDVYDAEWVLCVEEDAILSNDVFLFIDEIFNKYRKKQFFRGINLGSIETNPELNSTYSLLRYGFHGSAGVITRQSWNTLKLIRINKKLNHIPLDSAIEKYMRTGFMVTPNITKTLNFGWQGGTHTSSDPNQPHFIQMQQSWSQNTQSTQFRINNIEHSWGGSSILYKVSDQPLSMFTFILGIILDKPWYFGFRKKLSSIKRDFLRNPRS